MKKYHWNVKKCFFNVFLAIIIVLISWFIISLLEIVIKNTGINPVYSNYNLFKVILKIKGLL